MLLPGAAAAEPAPETTSVTDWLCSAIFGRGWQLLTGADLLPSAAADGEGAALLDSDPEAPSADEHADTRRGGGGARPSHCTRRRANTPNRLATTSSRWGTRRWRNRRP